MQRWNSAVGKVRGGDGGTSGCGEATGKWAGLREL